MTMPAIAAGVEVETLPSTAEERVGSVAEPMDMDMEDSCAHARPKMAETMVALEKYMLTVYVVFVCVKANLVLSMRFVLRCSSRQESGWATSALGREK